MPELPATCELWVDGVRYPDGSDPFDPAEPFAVSGLTVHWGRDNTVDQPQPATCTFTVTDPPGGQERFDSTVLLGSAVVVWAAVAGTRVVVFGGRVTDLTARWDDAAGAGSCDVVAADLLADLANRFVGAEPWAAQTLLARAQRILTAVGVSTAGLTVATRPAALTVSRMDVDRQAAAGLLLELAVTAGAVLWSAYDPALGAPYLFYEDPAGRASLFSLEQDPVSLLWAPATAAGGAGTGLSACNVLRAPVTWARAVTDLVTRVTVRWLDQTTSPGTTERSVAVLDTAAEATYGARGLSVGTILTTSADASTLASGLLAAHQPSPSWRTAGLAWDLADTDDPADPETIDLATRLLDNKARLGLPIALTDLPYWTPTAAAVSLYVEGGDYRFDRGRWVLALTAAPATGLGGSMSFDTFNRSVRYVDMDRTVSYLDLIGVGPTIGHGPDWADVPAGTTWAAVPADHDWSEGP